LAEISHFGGLSGGLGFPLFSGSRYPAVTRQEAAVTLPYRFLGRRCARGSPRLILA